MDEVSDVITKENKATGANINANNEEERKGKERATANEALVKRIREMSASGGKRNGGVVQEVEDEDYNDKVENRLWAKTLLPVEKN